MTDDHKGGESTLPITPRGQEIGHGPCTLNC